MRPRRTLLGAAVVLAVALAAACGGSGSSGGSSSGGSHTPVTLTVWHQYAGEEATPFKNGIAAFEKQYPWIHVKLELQPNPDQGHVRPEPDRGHQGRQRPRRRHRLHAQLRRAVLLERPVGRPDALHAEGQHVDLGVRTGHAELHEGVRQAVRAAVTDRRLRPLLQHRHVQEGGHHLAAEDDGRARRRREEAHRQATPTARSRWPGSSR